MSEAFENLCRSIGKELQNFTIGYATNLRYRTLPVSASQFLRRIEGIYDLSGDFEISLPNEVSYNLSQLLIMIPKILSGKEVSNRDLLHVTKRLVWSVEPWNPLPSKGKNHKMRRTATSILLNKAAIIYGIDIKSPETNSYLQKFGISLAIEDDTPLKQNKGILTAQHRESLKELTAVIAKTHVYLTVMETIASIYLIGDLTNESDYEIFNFLQMFPWYLCGPTGAIFMETIRQRCFVNNRTIKTKKKMRREHPVFQAISKINLDLPTGIRERSHTALPLEFPVNYFLNQLIRNGGLWSKNFPERVLNFFSSDKGHPDICRDRILRYFKNIRESHGAQLTKIFSKDPRFEQPETILEFLKIEFEQHSNHPTFFLSLRNGVFRCSLPFFEIYS